MLFYDIVVSILCFVVVHFSIRRLVSFNIFCCRKNRVSFQGSNEHREPKRDEEDQASTDEVYVLS